MSSAFAEACGALLTAGILAVVAWLAKKARPYWYWGWYVALFAVIFASLSSLLWFFMPLFQKQRLPTLTVLPTPAVLLTPVFLPTVALPTVVLPTATLRPPLFTDEFAGKPDPAWEYLAGTWVVVNDKLTIFNANYNAADADNWTTGKAVVGNPLWENYVLTMTVDFKNDLEHNRATILCYFQNDENYLALTIWDAEKVFGGKAMAQWWIVQAGNSTPVSNSVFLFNANEDFRISVFLKNDLVTTYINGEKQNQWSGGPFVKGKVGVILSTTSVNSVIDVDDFIVKENSWLMYTNEQWPQ